MLIITLQVNTKHILTLGAHNVHPHASKKYTGECPYDIYIADYTGGKIKFDIGKPDVQINHRRKDGAEILAAKALQKISEIKKHT